MRYCHRGSKGPDQQKAMQSACQKSKFFLPLNFVFRFFYCVGCAIIGLFARIGDGVIRLFTKPAVKSHQNRTRKIHWKRVVPAAASIIAVFMGISFANLTLGYAVAVQGKTVAYVMRPDDIDTAIQGIYTKLITCKPEEEPTIQPEITVSIAKKHSVVDSEKLSNMLINSTDTIAQGYGILADGQLVAAAADEEQLNAVLDSMLQNAATGKENEVVEFERDVQVVNGLFLKEDFCEPENLEQALDENTTVMYYTVALGDTIESMAQNFDMSVEEFLLYNNGADTEISVGDVIRVRLKESLLSVKTYQVETYTEEIPFETVESVNPLKDASYSAEILSGENGLQEITAHVTYLDNTVIEKEVISTEVVKQPVQRQMVVGGAQGENSEMVSPEGDGITSGSIVWPVERVANSYVSARFGDGRNHTGWDIAAALGSEIYAADGGTVISVNATSGSYGQHFVVEHANGLKTLYGHCSRLLVNKGQKVSKGELIALVGSTGYSTGPHLHIEFWQGAQKLDPTPFLEALHAELFAENGYPK